MEKKGILVEALKQKRKLILEKIDIDEIDFNDTARLISIKAIKCDRVKFIHYGLVTNRNLFDTNKHRFNNNKIIFNGNQLNIGFIECVEELQNKIDDLCVEYYYYIKEHNICISVVAKALGGSYGGWLAFLNKTIFSLKKEHLVYSLNKKKISFLIKIDEVLSEIEKSNKDSMN
jgi:hypothetical protein